MATREEHDSAISSLIVQVILFVWLPVVGISSTWPIKKKRICIYRCTRASSLKTHICKHKTEALFSVTIAMQLHQPWEPHAHPQCRKAFQLQWVRLQVWKSFFFCLQTVQLLLHKFLRSKETLEKPRCQSKQIRMRKKFEANILILVRI